MRVAGEFNPYRDDVAWIDNIVQGCELEKLKHITHKIGSGKTPRGGLDVYQKKGVLFLRSQNIFNNGINLDNVVYISKELDDVQKNSRVYNGDVLFNITGSSIGRASVFDLDISANVNQHVCIIRCNDELVYYKYLYYVLISDICRNYIDTCKEGVNRAGITHEQLGDFVVPIYPIKKQKEIADYLDKKCKLINDSIEKQKESIKKICEFKDSFIQKTLTECVGKKCDVVPSGVDFIDDIPIGWGISKLRYIASKIGSGKTPRGGEDAYSKKGILFLRCQNILDGKVDINCKTYISESTDEKMKNSRVYSGDVLLNITGGSIGRCAVYSNDFYANVSQHVCIIRPIVQNIDSEYLQYVILSKIGQSAIEKIRMGINRESLNFEQIGNIKVPIPPLEEQNKIVDYLKKKLITIDAVIEKKNSYVSKLLEYKRSIIFEAVTSKADL